MKLRLLLLPVAVGAAAFSNANLLSNPGFDAYTGSSFLGYSTLAAGNTDVTGWTVGQTSVDIVDGNYTNMGLPYAIDLAGTPGPGSMLQGLSVANGFYQVSFMGWTNQTGDAGTVVLSFGGTQQSFVLTSTPQTYSFITSASGATTYSVATLASNSTNGNIFVDNASVEAVPEPASMAALGLGALGLLKRRRK